MASVHKVRHNEEELEYWTRVNNIVGLRAAGMSNPEIAAKLKVSLSWVEQAVVMATRQQRDAVADRVNLKFMLQDARLEQLWSLCQAKIDEMLEQGTFSEGVVRSSIMVLERMSRLWNLDRAKRGERGGGDISGLNDWLDNATWPELAAKAREYGLNVPDKFDLGEPVTPANAG